MGFGGKGRRGKRWNGKGSRLMWDRSPHSPEKMVIKRVIALEGDTVITKSPYPFPKETVPLGHVWVEGEHPEGTRHSNDSNLYGPVSLLCCRHQIRTFKINTDARRVL